MDFGLGGLIEKIEERVGKAWTNAVVMLICGVVVLWCCRSILELLVETHELIHHESLGWNILGMV